MIETRSGRPLTLGEQRKLAAELRDQRRSYAEIAAQLSVSPIRARDLCLQYDRLCKLNGTRALHFELSKRALLCLLTGPHANRMGGSVEERMARLLEIATSYTRRQLLDEEGVGAKTVDEIGAWLESKGHAFRTPRSMSRAPATVGSPRAEGMEASLA